MFKIKWVIHQYFSVDTYKSVKSLLSNWYVYYIAIVSTLFTKTKSHPYIFYLRSGESIRIYDFMAIYIFKEIFLDNCYDNLSLNQESPVIVDIGSNIGLFALKSKIEYPNSRLLCVEPFPPNFNHLKELVSINNLINIDLINTAVLGYNGSAKLYIHPKNSGGHSVYDGIAGKHYIEVPSVTLFDLFKTNGIEKCHLLKMDCEGAEFQILKSLTHEISKKIESIIIEPTTKLYPIGELYEILESLGYNYRIVDGIIFASSNIQEENEVVPKVS